MSESSSQPASNHEAFNLLKAVIVSGRMSFRTEAELHQIITCRLPAGFEHEFILSSGDRADFFRPSDGMLVEIKSSTGKTRGLPRQLERYMRLPEVTAGIVIAPSFKCVIPGTLCGKPVWGISIFKLCL
jgi:hypothetical protein